MLTFSLKLKLGEKERQSSVFSNSRTPVAVSGGTALLALIDTVGVSQLEDGQHGQTGVQALLQVARADLVPHHTLNPFLLENILVPILVHSWSTSIVACNYHFVKTGLIFRDIGDACGIFFDLSQILVTCFWPQILATCFWPQVLKEEGEAGNQHWEEKPKNES